ncbi:TetR family transcriptional regulator [Formicincola oecophyllae]|uniref:TetR family transcriptional regulator n=1 Tax=Formicincola oecophyllae TaxID=2558361 RepID=A0A4Y6U7S7_9PROT|nr:TetR family transcriptional regulator [Formicincola oecophyllae]QDH13483.1 TetR family transcriptional regulator [Formicincola oecophyllae]
MASQANATTPTPQEKRLLQSAMALAGERGWHGFTLVQAAEQAAIPLAQARVLCPFKPVLMGWLEAMADSRALSNPASGTVREKLFEQLMARLDVFQDYRPGVVAALRVTPLDPALAITGLVSGLGSLRWLADRAGLDRRGLLGLVRLQALGMAWMMTLRTWERDKGPDMAQTMKTLDEGLERLERRGFLKAAQPIAEPAEPGVPDHLIITGGAASSPKGQDGDDSWPDELPPDL